MYKILNVYQNSQFEGVFIKIENSLIDTRTYYYNFKELYSMKYTQFDRKYIINTLYVRNEEFLNLYIFVERYLLDYVKNSLIYEVDKFDSLWKDVQTTSNNIKDKKRDYMFVKSSTFLCEKVTKGIKGAKNGL
ncbi:MAG: hypothetical protein ACRC5T_03845 [Cetobacterium sp.]